MSIYISSRTLLELKDITHYNTVNNLSKLRVKKFNRIWKFLIYSPETEENCMKRNVKTKALTY